jgi:hypothetical protein
VNRIRRQPRSVIPVSMSRPDGDRIAEAAGQIDKPLSTFVREAALAEADRILGPTDTEDQPAPPRARLAS